jgi:hypothetical protein
MAASEPRKVMEGDMQEPPDDLAGFLDRLALLAEQDHRWLAGKVRDARAWQDQVIREERQARTMTRADARARRDMDELELLRCHVDRLLDHLATIARRAREERAKLVMRRSG